MNKIFRTLWNPPLGTWVAAPEISRGHARSSSGGGVRAVAAAVALLVCAVPVLAAGGAGGQPVGDTSLNADAGGSDGTGGSGGLNDTTVNAFGGAGGASAPGGVTAGANASIGGFGTATPGTGGAAGATSTPTGPGAFQGDAGGAGQAQTGGPGVGDGYGGGGGGGFQGASIANNISNSSDSYTGGIGGAGGANGVGGAGVTGVNLALTNGGTISGGLGGDGVTSAAAVAFTGGANSLTLNTGSSMSGAIAIGTGATASVIAGADGLGVNNALLLGGTGTIDTNGHDLAWSGAISGASDLVKAGAGVLTLSGADTHAGGTNVAAGTLRTGAANTLSAASAFTVASGATLDLAGNSQAIASMANSGTVSLVGTVPGTTLTVNGPWVGNGGTLRLGTALGGSASASDRLILSGATAVASGTTNVQITNLGGLGALTTGSGIEVISAINGATTTAQTTKSAFSLAGAHVDAGAYEYRLYAADASGAGENWYLRSTAAAVPPAGGGTGTGGVLVPTYRAEVPLYAALPEQLRQSSLAMLGNMHQRTGDDFAAGVNNTPTPAQGYRQAWGRIISTDRTISQGGTVSPTSKGRLTGFQAGTDLWADPNFRVGVYVGQLDGDMRVNGFASGLANLAVGTNDLKSEYLGAYATWKNDGGLYVDGVLQAGRHRYTASPALGLSSGGKGNSLLASIEVGQSFAIAEHWTIEPQLQLVHQRVNLGEVGIAGALVQQDSHNGWLARAGVRVKGEIATGAGLLQPYVRANVYRSSSGSDVTRFIGPAGFADIATRTGGTSTELAAGATLQLAENMSVYAELGKLWGSSGDARIKSGVNASVGVKMRW